LATTVVPTSLVAQDFYAGKTISIIVSGAGIYEAYGRAFARYMPKYIPGRPNMIVQQMPGGGGLQAASYIYRIAPRDGTTIAGTHGAVLTAKLMSPDVVDFDITKLSWIGNATRDSYLAYFWHTAPVQSYKDLLTTEVIVGGSAVGSAGIDMAIVGKELFGFKLKIVSGYKTSPETKLALEKGEIQGTMGNGWSDLNSRDWLETGKVRIVLQYGKKPRAELPNVPLLRDLARDESERQMLDVLGVREEAAKPYFAPPGIPPERLAILRKAFSATLSDPEYLKEAKQQRMEVDEPLNGEEMAALANRVASTPPAVVAKLVALFKNYKDR
jgi:tripartite-type tricarboxylate transporter receptor subunit TctC